MASLTQLIEKFNPRLVRPAVYSAVDLTEREWVLKQIEQLAAGKNSKGGYTARVNVNYYPYAQMTLDYKHNLPGLAGVIDRVTLYDTGAYYARIVMKREGNKLSTFSTDGKAAELEQDYPEHLGLNRESKKEYIDENFRSELFNQLKLNEGPF